MPPEWRGYKIQRPEPIVKAIEAIPVTRRSRVTDVMAALDAGLNVLIEDFYSTGLEVLFGIKTASGGKGAAQSFEASRASRGRYRELSNRIYIPVEDNRIALRNSPEIGWLQRLYPDCSDFLMQLPTIQGLNSSWQWYSKGIRFPVLDYRVHPYYGVYFPTRFDHLEMFERWLKDYRGRKRQAIEIGTGCGVLSFQLLNNGFEMIHAGDISVNALVSVAENAEKQGTIERFSLHRSDLFETIESKADLVLFNPPWLPATDAVRGLDRAIYHEADLLERFFRSAGDHVADKGKIVLLFSNLAQEEGISDVHPLRRELENNKRFRCFDQRRKNVRRGSAKTRRRPRRGNESVELWVLEKR